MLDESLRDLKVDRRMLERRGWITRQERAAAFAALPDVADKVAPQEESPPAATDAEE